jgi:hypothetical protein
MLLTMAVNRIRRYSSPARDASTPQSAVETTPQGFAVCPPQLAAANAWQQEIYRLAYQRAQAAAQIPRHHRILFSVWN